MAEEFQAGICGGNWWNPSRSLFSTAATVASPCSMGLGHVEVAGFGWGSHDNIIDHNMVEDNKAGRSNNNSSGDTNNSVCESPNISFQEVLQKPNHHHHQTDHHNSLNIDSTLQMMGFGLSPSDLSQSNLVRSNNGRSESMSDINSTMYSMLQEEMGLTKLSNTNYRQDHQIQSASLSSSGFPVSSASYGYNPATLLQSLFDAEAHHHHQQQQQSFPINNRSDHQNYSSNNYGSNNNGAWPRNVSASKQLSHNQPGGGLHFSNNTPFWNASEQVVSSESNVIRSGQNLIPSAPQPPQLQHQYATNPTFEPKPKCNNNTSTKPNMVCNEDQARQDSGSSCAVKKSSSANEQPVLKRARIETPSPLPTFKVRKEKLGDRITALQQLVSPFGKTDTASVLHEAIEYIKFLHDQVLSTPYMKNGSPSVQVHHQQGSNNKLMKNQDTPKQDLKSRGLCLVPISSTFPVANETTADFWTPTFGGTFR